MIFLKFCEFYRHRCGDCIAWAVVLRWEW